MAKRKIVRRKKSASRVHRGTNIEFNSWTFFLFLLFVLLATMILLAQQKGINLFRTF